MKILSIDSSNKSQSISLFDASLGLMIFEKSLANKSSALMPLIAQSFAAQGLRAQDIQLLVANLGPGSFTGLRTALTLIKTFAQQLDLKIFVTNNFQLIRFEKQLGDSDPVAIVAGKNDYYISLNSDWHNPEKNFYSADLGTTRLYTFEHQYISSLMIELYKSKQDPELIGYKELVPYYLREPSIGLVKL